MLIHGLYPVAARGRGCARRWTACGPYMETHGGDVELLGDRGRRRAAAPAGLLPRLRARRRRRSSSASSRRSRRPRPTSRGSRSVGEEEILGVAAADGTGWRSVERARRAAPGGARHVGRTTWWSPTSTATCSPTATRARRAAPGSTARLLEGATLCCPSCAHSFELRLAGRSTEGSGLQLAPVPLLREGSASRWPREGEPRARHRPAPVPRDAGRAGRALEEEEAQCELCPIAIPSAHKHLLHLDERRILCVCATCWATALRRRASCRPVGNRTAWLDGFALSDEQWAAFQLPIGLAFLMISSVTGSVVALYPSPAGATESELDLRGVGGRVRGQPGARAGARRRGAGRQPASASRTST